MHQKYEYEYNSYGLKTQCKWIDQIYPTASSLITYEYDNNNNLVKEASYDLYSLEPIGYDTYEYDSNGNKDRWHYSPDNILGYYCDYKYDSYGNCIEGNIYNPDGSLKQSQTMEYKYDSKGNIIYEKITDKL